MVLTALLYMIYGACRGMLLFLQSQHGFNYVFSKTYKSQMQSKQNRATIICFNYVVLKSVLFLIFLKGTTETQSSIKYYVVVSTQSCCACIRSHFIPSEILLLENYNKLTSCYTLKCQRNWSCLLLHTMKYMVLLILY